MISDKEMRWNVVGKERGTYRCQVRLRHNTRSRIQTQLHFAYLPIYLLHESTGFNEQSSISSIREQAYWMMKSTILCFNMVSECVFVIKNEISYPYPTNTSVAVDRSYSTVIIRTGTGFLRSTMKLSARCIMNRVNL